MEKVTFSPPEHSACSINVPVYTKGDALRVYEQSMQFSFTPQASEENKLAHYARWHGRFVPKTFPQDGASPYCGMAENRWEALLSGGRPLASLPHQEVVVYEPRCSAGTLIDLQQSALTVVVRKGPWGTQTSSEPTGLCVRAHPDTGKHSLWITSPVIIGMYDDGLDHHYIFDVRTDAQPSLSLHFGCAILIRPTSFLPAIKKQLLDHFSALGVY